MRSSNTGGTSVNYTYDALNRLSTVKDNRLASGTTTYTYDNAGNLPNYLYPNGVADALHLQHAEPPDERGDRRQSGDAGELRLHAGPAGNRTQVAELGGRQVNYTYDALYRLTGETIAGGPRRTAPSGTPTIRWAIADSGLRPWRRFRRRLPPMTPTTG